tara:strand:- start:1093 stop:1332 length:240 start_codon:yes stop_codon:yes gene_type:complete
MKLNINQLQERSENKLLSKLFFAEHKLKEIQLQLDGVVGSKVSVDILLKNFKAQTYEVQVLKYMIEKIIKNNKKKVLFN